MLDIKFLRENPEIVKENIKKKFQDAKLPLVDEVIELDAKVRALKQKGGDLRAERNSTSNTIGSLMREGKKDEAMAMKARVVEINAQLVSIAKQVPPNTMLDLKKITPRCMWYVEHALNGDQKDTHNCIWYQNINMPKIPTQ